jgi:hypothetical protein
LDELGHPVERDLHFRMAFRGGFNAAFGDDCVSARRRLSRRAHALADWLDVLLKAESKPDSCRHWPCGKVVASRADYPLM